MDDKPQTQQAIPTKELIPSETKLPQPSGPMFKLLQPAATTIKFGQAQPEEAKSSVV